MSWVNAAAVTTKPDPFHGKELAQQLCSNCHLIDSQQQHVNVDVPSFNEIAAWIEGGGKSD
jgi:hypothetical protein